MLSGNVLITGGAGFLGRALIAANEADGWGARITVLSRDDAKHAVVQKRWPHVETVLGDVATMPLDQLALLMRGFDSVIHAAASKYVDRSEHAAFDTVATNVIGSVNVARAAILARVQRVVGVSTDKAVAPLNNYGATKMLMERVFQEADGRSATAFTVVRYGNVMASTGSVAALFREWVAQGKPIRLTNPAMTRFWMSPHEAVATVLEGLQAPRGCVVVPRCRAATMHDVALSALGYDEHDVLPEDGRVEVVGLRPGEKMHEALLQKAESVRAFKGQLEREYGSWRYIYIRPPDTAPINADAFDITSNQPPGGWIGPREIRELIEQAEGV